MNTIKVCGIDPGFNGGIAVIETTSDLFNARPVFYTKMPIYKLNQKKHLYLKEIVTIFREVKPAVTYLEQAEAMPKQGLVSTARFFYYTGAIEGILTACGLFYVTVRANIWKKKLKALGVSRNKSDSLQAVKNLFGLDLKKKEDGIAEAMLIAYYGAIDFYIKEGERLEKLL